MAPTAVPRAAPPNRSMAACPTAPLWTASAARAPAKNRFTKGVAIPSFSPLSTFRARRTPDGIRSSRRIEAPRAASVGATMAPMAAATQRSPARKTPAAIAPPATMVRGRPIASNRAGSSAWARSVLALTRDASEKSTRARVISAKTRMSAECRWSWTRLNGPLAAPRPRRTKAIGAVTSQRSSRAETSAQRTTHPEITAMAALSSWCMFDKYTGSCFAGATGWPCRWPQAPG